MIPTLRLDGSWRWSDATTGEPQQAEWRSYIEQLGQAAETPITDLATLFEAFEKISDFFADHGGVSMDLGLDESELRLEQERAGLDASAIFTRLI